MAVVEPQPDAERTGGEAPAAAEGVKKRRRRTRRRVVLDLLIVIVLLLTGARLMLPTAVRWYVNRTLDQDPIYDGRIGDVDIHLWRGAYAIEDVRINKVIGAVPAPLFECRRLDLAIEWRALWSGKVAGKIAVLDPAITFVDSEDPASDQTGAGGPWLAILSELLPFDINSVTVTNGTVNFRAVDTDPPVELQLTELDVRVDNLTNVRDETTPLVSSVRASGLAQGHAKVDFEARFDPFSYNPTFQLGLKMIGLDVTRTNDLARAYGQFDFEHGWFDLVVEIDAKEGRLEGYVKPLFRNLKVFSLRKDVTEDNVLGVFWEAVVGGVSEVFENQPRDQVGTFIPVSGNLSQPRTDLLATLLNVLRNAFVRAYLPRLEGQAPAVAGMQFGPGSADEPGRPLEGTPSQQKDNEEQASPAKGDDANRKEP